MLGDRPEVEMPMKTSPVLPTASTCYVLAARMGYNGPYVAGLVTLSTILGVLSLPYALSLMSMLPTP